VSPHDNPSWQPGRLRVLLADDHELYIEALTMTLELDERLEVVGRARDGKEAIDLASALQPDVVLMDLHMPVLDGFEGTRGVVHAAPGAQVVVVTSSTSADDERRALEAGASAYVRKGGCSSELFDAVFGVTREDRSARRKERPASPRALPNRGLGTAANRARRAWL
jgi:DNA-binding NarL/FixJ family response regulator